MSKKAQTTYVIYLLAIIISFIAISAVLTYCTKKASTVVDEAVCRASVETSAKANIGIGAAGVTVKTVKTPLLCATKNKKLSGEDSEIKKQLADLIAKCWWEFGQGTVADPFKSGTAGGDQECMVCYTVSIDDDDFKISSENLIQYLSETTYLLDENDKNINYLDYISKYGAGTGGNLIMALPSEIKSPEVYAISFGASTNEPGDFAKAGAWYGAVAGGAVAIWCLSNPAGWTSCGLSAAATMVAGGAVAGAIEGAEIGVPLAKLLEKKNRKVPTIYLTTLNEVADGNVCNVYNG